MKRYLATLSVLMLVLSLFAVTGPNSGLEQANAEEGDTCPDDGEWEKYEGEDGGNDDIKDGEKLNLANGADLAFSDEHNSDGADTVNWELDETWLLDLCIKSGKDSGAFDAPEFHGLTGSGSLSTGSDIGDEDDEPQAISHISWRLREGAVLTVEKVVTGDQAPDDPQDYELLVKDSNGFAETVTVIVPPDDSNSETLRPLEPGEYTVSESDIPDAVETVTFDPESQTVALEQGEAETVTVTNDYGDASSDDDGDGDDDDGGGNGGGTGDDGGGTGDDDDTDDDSGGTEDDSGGTEDDSGGTGTDDVDTDDGGLERSLTLDPDVGSEGDQVELIHENCELTEDSTVIWDGESLEVDVVDGDFVVEAPAGEDGETVTVTVEPFDDCTASFTYDQPVGVADRTITRLPGATRIETAIEVSQEMFESADTVVLARSDLYPDALTGGPFAHAIDAPILLTPPDRLVPQTADEIQRLGANEVVLLGLTAALSEDVQAEVDDLPGVGTDRVGGSDRFGTARRVANRLLDETGKTAFERAYLAEGAADEDPTRGWPDPIAVSALASHEAQPILLTLDDLLPPATRDSLEEHDPAIVDIVGGEVAVTSEVVDEAGNHTDATFTRDLAGDTRFHTSALIADRSVEVGMDPASLWLATGDNWPDGLVAGPTVARDGGVLLLVPKDTFDNAPHSLQWLQDTKASLPAGTEQIIRILGGEAAISSQVVDELP